MKPKQEIRIVFMGTPTFAVASLEALVQHGFNVVAVITAPDKPAGRGLLLTESAVKKFAVANGIQVLQPTRLKDPEFITQLKDLQADLQVVVAFRMLPEIVWNMPPMGTINVHGSLLPQYRGAAPINWAVINGETTTGVTTFKLKHEIDTGDILMQQAFAIGENETAGEVHDRMMGIGAAVLVKTLEGLIAGTIDEKPQSILEENVTIKHAPKLFTGTGAIDWSKPVATIYNLIRGLSPSPGAYTVLNDKLLKIYQAQKESSVVTEAAGTVLTDNKTYLKFAAADGYINLIEIQLEGKKRMLVTDFLRGYKVLN